MVPARQEAADRGRVADEAPADEAAAEDCCRGAAVDEAPAAEAETSDEGDATEA